MYMLMFISAEQYEHLVKTFVIDRVEYKYYDITAVAPNYGMLLWWLLIRNRCGKWWTTLHLGG